MKEILHIYTRVSSLVQSEDGTSLETQKLDGIKKSVDVGYDYRVWNEGGKSSSSSTLDSRPVLVDLLSEIEKGNVKNLYVYNTDRLSRNDRTWSVIRWKLKSNDVVVHTNTGRIDLSNPLDDLLMGLLSEISQYDNTVRSERSRRGKLHKVQQGFFQGGPTPFGYKNEKKRLVVDLDESQWIKRMYKMYSEGKSVHEIRGELNENGVITRRGNPFWSLGSINKILRNSTYVGWYNYTDKKSEETVRVEIPPIIDQIIWDLVQSRIDKFVERKHQINRTTNFYLLRDFMTCGHCGQQMSGKIGPNNNFYYCPRKERNWVNDVSYKGDWVRGKGCGMTRSLNISRTDEVVWESVLNVMKESKVLRESFKGEILESVKASRRKQKSISNKIERSRKKLKEDLKEVEKTVIGFETSVLLKKFSGNSDQIREKLQIELENIKNKLKSIDLDEKKFLDEQKWVSWIDKYDENLESTDSYSDEQKKEFLNGVVKNIYVNFNSDENNHTIEIEFNLPIVGDQIIYNDPLKRIKGWKIVEGKNLLKLDPLSVSKGGRPSKSKSM